MKFDNVADRLPRKLVYIGCLFWVVTFIIYLPAAKAGFVSDTTGWLQSLREDSFADYLNRSRFGVKSMYQVTQFNTWVLYHIFGASQRAWHLLFVTLQATDCLLLYALSHSLFKASGIQKPHLPALAGALLFCVSPYNTEVVVWEASFHYLQAFICLFSILMLVQRFQHTAAWQLPVASGIIFALSTFTHELWYLIPLFTCSLAIFYRIGLYGSAKIFRKTIVYFTLPQVLLFAVHLWAFRMVYGGGISHVGSSIFNNPPEYFYVKAPWYFFHLFAWGRFFPEPIKHAVYDVFRRPGIALGFYALLGMVCLVIVARFRRMAGRWKMASLLFVWLLFAVAIFVPLWFPESLLVVCDRYTYIMLSFQCMLVALLFYSIPNLWLRRSAWLAVFLVNLILTLQLSLKWRQSAQVIYALQTSTIFKPGKVKLLLNAPACLQGIPMIGSSPEGEFRLMHNLLYPPIIKDTMLEVAAYNMVASSDGSHAVVMNDSTIKVTLNQWGTWWWLGGFGAYSYENRYYKLDMVDAGHWYQVTLKKPYTQYQILYQTGRQLKEVNMKQQGIEQN